MNARYAYPASLAMVAIVTGIGFATQSFLHAANLDSLYMLVVLISALKWGRAPGVVTAVVSALIFDYCFVPPAFSFHISDLAYLITLFGFVAVAVVAGALGAHSRKLILEQAARENAEESSEAKDEVLRKISHELRSPLTALLGWIQLIRHNGEPVPVPSESFDALESSARLLARLVDDLLDASRAGSGKLMVHLAPMPVAPVVSKAVDLAAVVASRKGVRLERAVEPVGEILGDEERIEQIVANLMSNAVKFTTSGGRIDVRLARVSGSMELSVSDSGMGIAPEFLPHVFDPFAQGDPKDAQGGLGLGLSIVKNLVEAHGGTIAASSAGRGLGATFVVKIPLAESNLLTGAPLHPGHDAVQRTDDDGEADQVV